MFTSSYHTDADTLQFTDDRDRDHDHDHDHVLVVHGNDQLFVVLEHINDLYKKQETRAVQRNIQLLIVLMTILLCFFLSLIQNNKTC
jgi:ABC-type nickel/cobalt efflux system permease component RcnA